ncbi:MAG: transcriptional regulator [Pseudomonadota bacterium]
MNIKPIRTKEDYESACRRIDQIFQAEPGSPDDDELEIVATLVDAYEEKHFPMGMPHPVTAIKIQMEDLGLTRKDLMEGLGKSSGRISDILNCRRALTLGDVRTLGKLLHIPAEVLLQDYPLEEAKPKEVLRTTERAATC